MQYAILPIFLFLVGAIGLAVGLVIAAGFFNSSRPGRVKQMPYESGMDPIHDTRRRFDVRFYLVAIAFLVFDVELLFLFPWAVASRKVERSEIRGQRSEIRDTESKPLAVSHSPLSSLPSPLPTGIDAAVAGGLVENRHLVFAGAMAFVALLVFGFIYDWRKGIFQWR